MIKLALLGATGRMGERVLGLPREPRADKQVPWKDIPRS